MSRFVLRRGDELVSDMEPLPAKTGTDLTGIWLGYYDDEVIFSSGGQIRAGEFSIRNYPYQSEFVGPGPGAIVASGGGALMFENRGQIWRSTVVPPTSPSDWKLVHEHGTGAGTPSNQFSGYAFAAQGDLVLCSLSGRASQGATSHAVLRSTDGGMSWTSIEIPFGKAFGPFTQPVGDDTWVLGWDDTLESFLVSRDAGKSWGVIPYFAGNTSFGYSVQRNGSGDWLVADYDNDLTYVSSDDGFNFTPHASLPISGYYSWVTDRLGRFYIAGTVSGEDRVYRWGGSQWDLVYSRPGAGDRDWYDPGALSPEGRIVVRAEAGLFLFSDDDGDTWHEMIFSGVRSSLYTDAQISDPNVYQEASFTYVNGMWSLYQDSA